MVSVLLIDWQCWTVTPSKYPHWSPAFCPSCNEFVYPGCWHSDNGATSKIDHVLIEHGGPPHVLPLAVHLIILVGWIPRCCSLQHFSVSPKPLDKVFELIKTWFGLSLGGLGTKGLGPVLDNFHEAAYPHSKIPLKLGSLALGKPSKKKKKSVKFFTFWSDAPPPTVKKNTMYFFLKLDHYWELFEKKFFFSLEMSNTCNIFWCVCYKQQLANFDKIHKIFF